MACACSENAGESLLLKMEALVDPPHGRRPAKLISIDQDVLKRLKARFHPPVAPLSAHLELDSTVVGKYSNSPIRSKRGASDSEKALAAEYRAKEEPLLYLWHHIPSSVNRFVNQLRRAQNEAARPHCLHLGSELCAACLTTVSTNLYVRTKLPSCLYCMAEGFSKPFEKEHAPHEFLGFLDDIPEACTCSEANLDFHTFSDVVQNINNSAKWLASAHDQIQNVMKEISKRLVQNREAYHAVLESEELKGRITELKSRKDELAELQDELARVEEELKRLNVQ